MENSEFNWILSLKVGFNTCRIAGSPLSDSISSFHQVNLGGIKWPMNWKCRNLQAMLPPGGGFRDSDYPSNADLRGKKRKHQTQTTTILILKHNLLKSKPHDLN